MLRDTSITHYVNARFSGIKELKNSSFKVEMTLASG